MVADRWNFGPIKGEMTVLQILQIAKQVWPEVKYTIKEEETHPSMVMLLKIDSTNAINKLGWNPQWDMEKAVAKTIEWYRQYYLNGKVLTQEDIDDYEKNIINTP